MVAGWSSEDNVCNACMYIWLQLSCDWSNTSVLYQWHTSSALCDWGLDSVNLLPIAGITSAFRPSHHCHYTDMSWLHCATCMKQTIVPLTCDYCQFGKLCDCSAETTLVSVYFALNMHGCVVTHLYMCSNACMLSTP